MIQICCFSWFYVIVNWIFLHFRPLVWIPTIQCFNLTYCYSCHSYGWWEYSFVFFILFSASLFLLSDLNTNTLTPLVLDNSPSTGETVGWQKSHSKHMHTNTLIFYAIIWPCTFCKWVLWAEHTNTDSATWSCLAITCTHDTVWFYVCVVTRLCTFSF